MFYGSGQKDSCKAAQGKCSFPWDGIGLAHKRQLRFHRAVCKTAISPERCIIAPFILKGFGRCRVREHHAPSLQEPARLPVDGTRFSAVPSPDHRSVLPDRPESIPARVQRRCTRSLRFSSDIRCSRIFSRCWQERSFCSALAFSLRRWARSVCSWVMASHSFCTL